MKVIVLGVLTFFISFVTCENEQKEAVTLKRANPEDSIIQTNLSIYIDSCWNKVDTTFLSQIATDKFERNLNGIVVAKTKREMQAHMNLFFNAFPDLHLTLNKAYRLDNSAFLLWTCSGTHTGIFGETVATGKKVNVQGISQLHFDTEGNLYSEDVIYNELNLLQQLGYTLNLPILE